MTWGKKIGLAKEADPSLSDDAAADMVRNLEQFAELALEQYKRKVELRSKT